jgi:DNA-directed RNA polymerase specialized sigma24 family protein
MKVASDENIQFTTMPAPDLVEYISFKSEFPKEAELAFSELCRRFEKDLLRKAEVYCARFGYNEVIALDVAHCAFARVWKYPKFDIAKAKGKDLDKAVLLWMYPILYTQILKYQHAETCAEPEEEDLGIALDIDGFIDISSAGDPHFDKKTVKAQLQILESAFAGLTAKHKTVYLTYKAYEREGKNIPRSVSKKLQETLDIVPSTIRRYKKEALEQLQSYIKQINERKQK